MVNIIHWNPKKSVFKKKPFSYLPIKKRVNNFGDMIGPILVREMIKHHFNIKHDKKHMQNVNLLTIGSILHFASSGDIIWGSGRNGKIKETEHRFKFLDVRAVRGPLTKEFLYKKSIHCPSIFGDPALLLPRFFPNLLELSKEKNDDYIVVPNLNDFSFYKDDEKLVNPAGPFDKVIKRILQSEFVIGSSLHAIIVAEAFGIPARIINSQHESSFKYEDYYLGSGRKGYSPASSISSALELGGEPSIKWDEAALISSFPYDLWVG